MQYFNFLALDIKIHLMWRVFEKEIANQEIYCSNEFNFFILEEGKKIFSIKFLLFHKRRSPTHCARSIERNLFI
jgi:hypothetical protein